MNWNLKAIRNCLALVSRIAARGACSPDTQQVVDTLMELTFVLADSRRSGDMSNTMLERCRVPNLIRMRDDLNEIDSTAQDFTASDALKFASRSTWN
jgi:hypothetical protein